jgi:tape measure domain-containing protein
VSVVANVAINLDSSGAQQQLRQFQQGVKATDNAVSGLLKTVGKLAIALGAIQAVKFVFVKTAELESQTRSLEVLTGSATKAKQIIQELQQLGAVTPFTSSELIDSAKRLQAFGVETDKVVQTTRRLADVSGATGAELQGLVTAYGQVQAKGRLQGEELLQFQERGVALQGELQKMYGLSGEELRKALEKGRISAEAVEVAINRLTEKGGKYANGAIAQSDTLGGKFSTLIDNIEMLAKKIGKVLEPMLKRILDLSIAVIDKINEAMAGPDRKTANNELFNTRTEIKKLTTEIKAAEKAGIGMSKGLEIKGIDDNVIIPSAPVLPIMKAELTELTKKATYLEGRLKELNLPKAAKEDVKLTVPQLLEEKGGKDKAAREAEKAAKLAKQLAMDSAQYQMQIDDQVFRNQVDLDKLRYDLQRQLQEKELSNFVNKFTGAAKEQAGIIQSMMMGSTSFNAQIKELETKIKEAQQRLQSGTRMNQVQSTIVAGGGGGGFSTSQLNAATQAASKFTGVANMCSESVKAFYSSLGITLPGVTAWADTVRKAGTVMTDFNKIKPGDILATGRPGDTPHVGVYTGGQNVFHQSKSRGLKAGNYPDLNSFKGGYFVRPNAAMGGGVSGVPGENVDQTKAEIQGLTQQLALLKSQAKSFTAANLAAGILASTSAFREQTAQLGLQSEAFTLRNRLQMEGVKPELIEGELQVLAVNQRLRDAASALNMDNKDHVAIYNELNQAAITTATAIRAYAEATAAASSPIQQFIGSAQTQLKDLESVAVRVSQGIGDAVGNSLTKGIQGLVEGTTTAQQVFSDFLKSIGDILMQEGTKMIATYTAIAIAKSLAGLFGGGGSAIGGGSTYGGAASSSIFSAGTGTAFGGMSIPGFAAGGNPPIGKASLVGEKGPELFVPRASGTILPADATAAAMARYQRQGGSGGGNSSSDAMGADAAATPVLSMSFETTRFLGQDYVSTDQLQAAMMATEKRAATAGAKAGAAQVSSQMRNSPAYRRQVGLR